MSNPDFKSEIFEAIEKIRIEKLLQEALETSEGDIDLRKCTGLTALPADLLIEGDLDLDGCTGLTALPANLRGP